MKKTKDSLLPQSDESLADYRQRVGLRPTRIALFLKPNPLMDEWESMRKAAFVRADQEQAKGNGQEADAWGQLGTWNFGGRYVMQELPRPITLGARILVLLNRVL